MLIRLCAWHRQNFNRPKFLGFRFSRHWGKSHGFCNKCADILLEKVVEDE